jgi:chromosomal replication initiator protein
LTAEQSRRMTKTNPLNGHEMAGVIASMRLRLKSKPAAGVSATIDELLDEQPAMQGPSANDIAKAVAAVFGAKVTDLRSDVRDRRLAVPRQLAMHAMREIGHFQYGEIGSYFGGRTHSTVLHSCKRIASELEGSETLRWQFDQVCRRLKGSALENA